MAWNFWTEWCQKSSAELFNLEKFSILHNYYFEEVCYPTELFHSIELWNSRLDKGQLISKANCQAEDSSKKQTNEFVFTSMWRVRFLEESLARKRFDIIWPLVAWVKEL